MRKNPPEKNRNCFSNPVDKPSSAWHTRICPPCLLRFASADPAAVPEKLGRHSRKEQPMAQKFIEDFNLDTIDIMDRAKIQSLIDSANGTGWAAYNDTQYTEASPLAVAADTPTILPNNKGGVLEIQIPKDLADIGGWVDDSGKIQGLNGDAVLITLDFQAIPQESGTTLLDVWFDIGGAVGELYRRTVSFPRGQFASKSVTSTTLVYTLDTWEANGATVYVEASKAVDIHSIRAVMSRTHKARPQAT